MPEDVKELEEVEGEGEVLQAGVEAAADNPFVLKARHEVISKPVAFLH